MGAIFEKFRETAAFVRKNLGQLSKAQRPSVCVRLSVEDYKKLEKELEQMPADARATVSSPEVSDPNIIVISIYQTQFAIFKQI